MRLKSELIKDGSDRYKVTFIKGRGGVRAYLNGVYAAKGRTKEDAFKNARSALERELWGLDWQD